jgi:hypothetical protein
MGPLLDVLLPKHATRRQVNSATTGFVLRVDEADSEGRRALGRRLLRIASARIASCPSPQTLRWTSVCSPLDVVQRV